jgi:hypothetical protein
MTDPDEPATTADADLQHLRKMAAFMRSRGFVRHPVGFWVDPIAAMKLPAVEMSDEEGEQ